MKSRRRKERKRLSAPILVKGSSSKGSSSFNKFAILDGPEKEEEKKTD